MNVTLLPLMRLPSTRLLGLSLLCTSLAACSLLGGERPSKPAPPPEPVAPADPPPVPTHYFTLEQGQDVVGVVQITTATKDDTLTDIARRFNLGYEEVVRANPG